MRVGKQCRGGVGYALAYSLEAYSPSQQERYGARHGPGS